MAGRLKNGRGKTKTENELAEVKGVGARALGAEFEGTFVEEDGLSDGSLASSEFIPEVAEEEERVFGRDPLRCFVPIDETGGRLIGQSWAGWARNAQF